jgi:polyhydroxybutyrate depolymerase
MPGGHDFRRPLPLVIGLHANGNQASTMDARFGAAMRSGMASAGYLFVFPDGTFDAARGGRFWDATEACCRFDATWPVDDVSYLSALISEAVESYGADPDGVVIFGLSNGGFMAHRMACAASRLRAIVAINAATHLDFDRLCQGPARPSILHAHAYRDNVVHYHGGPFLTTGVKIPSVLTTVRDWVGRLECNSNAGFSSGDTMRLGATTDVMEYRGCAEGRIVTLWAFHSASHDVDFLNASAFVEHAIVGFGLSGYVRDSDGDGYRDDVDARPNDSGQH